MLGSLPFTLTFLGISKDFLEKKKAYEAPESLEGKFDHRIRDSTASGKVQHLYGSLDKNISYHVLSGLGAAFGLAQI